MVYVGYQMLPGIPLDKSTFNAMDTHKQEQALEGLASFMQRLHDFSIEIVRDCGVKEELYKGAYHPAQKQLIQQVDHLLAKEETEKIEAVFDAYERDDPNFSNPPALLHADLKPEHILHDPENGHITGVIDWGDVCIGDPDFDFTCPYLFYDRNFVIRLLHYFPVESRKRILEKTQFFITIRWLQDLALFYRSGDEKFVKVCLEKLKCHLGSLSDK